MSILYHISRFIRCERGVAATEFALALPMLAILIVGGFEVSRYVVMHQKLEKIAYTIADVVSQSETITVAQLDQAALAAAEIMDPYNFTDTGVIVVSSVYQPAGAAATVRWQYSGGGDLERASDVGVAGAAATLPNNLVLNDDDNVIIAEIFFRYDPFFADGVLEDSEEIYKVTIFKPRLGALTTPPV